MKNFFRGMTPIEAIVASLSSILALILIVCIFVYVLNMDEGVRNVASGVALYALVGGYPTGLLSVVYRLVRHKKDLEKKVDTE